MALAVLSTVQTTPALLPTPSPSTTLTQELTPPPIPPNQALTPQAVVQAQDDNTAIFTTGVLPWEHKTTQLAQTHPPAPMLLLQPPTPPSPSARQAGVSPRKAPPTTSPSSTTQSTVDSLTLTLVCAASGWRSGVAAGTAGSAIRVATVTTGRLRSPQPPTAASCASAAPSLALRTTAASSAGLLFVA